MRYQILVSVVCALISVIQRQFACADAVSNITSRTRKTPCNVKSIVWNRKHLSLTSSDFSAILSRLIKFGARVLIISHFLFSSSEKFNFDNKLHGDKADNDDWIHGTHWIRYSLRNSTLGFKLFFIGIRRSHQFCCSSCFTKAHIRFRVVPWHFNSFEIRKNRNATLRSISRSEQKFQ